MTMPPSAQIEEMVVQILVRGIDPGLSAGDVALDFYKASVTALRDKYAIMGYSWADVRSKEAAK